MYWNMILSDIYKCVYFSIQTLLQIYIVAFSLCTVLFEIIYCWTSLLLLKLWSLVFSRAFCLQLLHTQRVRMPAYLCWLVACVFNYTCSEALHNSTYCAINWKNTNLYNVFGERETEVYIKRHAKYRNRTYVTF